MRGREKVNLACRIVGSLWRVRNKLRDKMSNSVRIRAGNRPKLSDGQKAHRSLVLSKMIHISESA